MFHWENVLNSYGRKNGGHFKSDMISKQYYGGYDFYTEGERSDADE